MEKGTDTLVSTVKDHFAREWDMLEEMIGNIPDDEWMKGDICALCRVKNHPTPSMMRKS
jgi:hypothetical protein